MGYTTVGKKTYYYQTRKVGTELRRIYFRTGGPARIVAECDQTINELRGERLAESRRVKAELGQLRIRGDQLTRDCELLVKAAMIVAGFTLHARSEWRRRG